MVYDKVTVVRSMVWVPMLFHIVLAKKNIN